jgi:RND family efflux transporter MFP subunit
MTRSPFLLASIALLAVACGPEVSARDTAPPAAPAEAAAAALVDSPDAAPPLPAATDEARFAAGFTVADERLDFAAVLFSEHDAEVGPRSTGIVNAVVVDLGDVVRRGQLLARLDDARQLARVESATAARDLSRAEFERLDGLLERGFVTKSEHDQARYGLRVAEAVLREAEVELEYTRIVAPFDGVITRRIAGPGRAAEEGDPLFRVTALTPLRALARVPEREAARIGRGSAALVTAETGAQAEAIVARISPAVDPGSGTVEVLLDVPRPGPLRPGAGVMIRFAATPLPPR